jgi:hypothetical protein
VTTHIKGRVSRDATNMDCDGKVPTEHYRAAKRSERQRVAREIERSVAEDTFYGACDLGTCDEC